MNICFLRFYRISKALLHRPYYDNQRAWLRTGGQVATGVAIQNPFTFFYVNSNDWSLSHNWDYWNTIFTSAASVNNTLTIKTIYDPSISGFIMPKTAAFTSFTYNGSNSSSFENFNVSGSPTSGWNYYINGWKSGGNILFTFLGDRETYHNTPGTIIYVKDEGHYWTAGASSVSYGRALHSHSGYVGPQYTDPRSMGFSIRSVKE